MFASKSTLLGRYYHSFALDQIGQTPVALAVLEDIREWREIKALLEKRKPKSCACM
jgi:hypothetical protein